MKYLLLIFLFLSAPQAFSQEETKSKNAPLGLIRYPEVYQIIELEPKKDFQVSSLDNLPFKFNLIDDSNKLEVFIEYSEFSTFENLKEVLLENLKSALDNSASILNVHSFGKEYLPSRYWKYTSSAKTGIKPYPSQF